MPGLDENAPAKLFRSRAHWAEERAGAPVEEIGSGPLAKMVRLAMTDPDGDIWPYSILVEGRSFDGEAIRKLARELGQGG